jgi:hypothetical protein
MGHRSRSGSFRRGLQYVATDTVNQTARVEVQDQADAESAHAQISMQLRLVDGKDGSDCLDLKDHLPRDDDVGLETIADLDGLVHHWNATWRSNEMAASRNS